MKCPKCGYNSFEFHDSCTKCSNDLTGFKDTFGLKSIVLPLEARTAMAESMVAETAHQVADAVDVPNDMFSFDLPDENDSSSVASLQKDDPFSFDDEPVAASGVGGAFSFDDEQKSAQDKPEKDSFSDLLESTPQNDSAPLSAPRVFSAAPAPVAPVDSAGEFDMNNFSWDEPENSAKGSAVKPAEDDFNSLFGDKGDAKK
jgi:hypothetical protein